MELVELERVDSTSTHAAALLEAGRPAPFAVWAKSQTGGRGRRGQTWVSPPGNLYLTLVLPPLAAEDRVERLGCWPLKASVLLARLIQRRTGVRVTLKWPNDLLFGGRKLAGLLLESSIVGQRSGELFIGIGLNLDQAPEVAGPYATTSLREITGQVQDVRSWVEAIMEAIGKGSGELPLAEVAPAFEEFAIGRGQLWRGPDGGLFQDEGIAPGGGLLVSPLAPAGEAKGEQGEAGGPARPDPWSFAGARPPARPPIEVTSVDQGLTWVHMSGSKAPLWVADVGNSRIKVAFFEDARDPSPAQVVALSAGATEAELTEALNSVRVARPTAASWPQGGPLHVLSVNGPAAKRLAAAAVRLGLDPVPLVKRPVRSHGGHYRLTELGLDRLALVEGYLASRGRAAGADHGAKGAILISAGTATTIDVVQADGRHLGGLILPGLATALRSLHEAAFLLPQLEPEGFFTLAPGHDTRSAMTQGALLMTVGAVEALARRLPGGSSTEARPEAAQLERIVCGGFAPLLAPHLGARVEEALILAGARSMVLGGF